MQVCYAQSIMKHVALRSHCPINFALETFGDKWSLLVVRDMVFAGKRTYGEFLGSEEGIATNVLADRLALLQHEGIITKLPHPTDKRKEIFVLTEKGLDLIPVLLQIELWSSRYDTESNANPKEVRRLEKDFKKAAQKVREAVRSGQDEVCALIAA